jgi:ABC-type sugar transport system permease subunit
MNKRKLTLMQKRAISGFLFILPWLIGFIVFYVRSLVMTVQFSLSDIQISPSGYTQAWNGITNYKYIFTEHGSFNQTLVSSLGDIVIDVPLITFFSLLMAMLLNAKFKGRTLVRAIFFMPVIMNSEAIVAAMDLSRQMMTSGISASSSELMEAANSGVNVEYYMALFKTLALPDSVLDYVVAAVGRISDIVSLSGVQIVIFIAALQAVPSSLYEVAKIEGATTYETFWKVTFPMVMPHIITNIVYTVVDSFTDSSIVDLAYTEFNTNYNFGSSCAMSLVSTVLVCSILAIVCGWISKHTFYYN